MNPNGFARYLSLVKFSHTIFAMPFALLGFLLAIHAQEYHFSWGSLILVVLCMVFARNSAMSFNRFIDRYIDARNPRTAPRDIPSGRITPKNALIFSMVNALLFIATTYFINNLVFMLSPLALALVLGYSYTKRFTALCHFVLGLSLSLAPIGAYLSVTGGWYPLPFLFSGIVMLWVAGFDILYALQDEFFDRSESLRSIPAQLGRKRAIGVALLLHVVVLVLVAYAGFVFNLYLGVRGWLYWIGASLFVLLMLSQHAALKFPKLVGGKLPFAIVNGLSSIIYCTFTVASMYFPEV